MEKLIVGCGYLGQRVARRWVAAGHNVHVVTRSEQRANGFRHAGLNPIVADVTSPASLRALPNIDTVLYAVGFDRQAGHSIEHVYVDGLRHVLDHLNEPIGKFVYVSSTGVFGETEGEEVTEATECRPTRPGGKACLAAEQLLAESRFSNVRVVLRMAGIYGAGRIPRRDQIESGQPIAVPTQGLLNLIHVDDAASIVLAAEDCEKSDSLFLVSDGHPVRRDDYFRCLAELLGAPSPQFAEPAPGDPAVSRAAGSKRVSNQRMMQHLEVELAYPSYREGLAAIIAAEP